jgi:hypothetical protein
VLSTLPFTVFVPAFEAEVPVPGVPFPHCAFKLVKLVALVPVGTPVPVNRFKLLTVTASRFAA